MGLDESDFQLLKEIRSELERLNYLQEKQIEQQNTIIRLLKKGG